MPLVAALVVSARAPGNVVGPPLATQSLVIAVVASTDVYGVVAARGGFPTHLWLVALKDGSWMAVFIAFALLVLYFPDGRLPGARWRVVPVGFAVVFALFEVGTAVSPDAYQSPWQDLEHPRSTALWVVAMAMVRRSSP